MLFVSARCDVAEDTAVGVSGCSAVRFAVPGKACRYPDV